MLAELPPDAMERAVAAAGEADVAVVVVGTDDEWESEGFDRRSMDLPGEQDELIRRVAEANPRTVVVVNAGAPVTMDWIDASRIGAATRPPAGCIAAVRSCTIHWTGVFFKSSGSPCSTHLFTERNV